MSDPIITEYKIVFALHTGVTVMMQMHADLETTGDFECPFTINKNDVDLTTQSGKKITLKSIEDKIIAEMQDRGFFMIYEFNGEDMARVMPCYLEN